jgi:hypothetical protein
MQHIARGTLFVASDIRWKNYIKKTGTFFRIYPNIFHSIRLSRADLRWPSQMAQKICFNKKVKHFLLNKYNFIYNFFNIIDHCSSDIQILQVGIGIFREGIVPDCDHQSQHNGGYFFMILFEKAGNYDGKIDKLDQMFDSFLQFVFGGGLTTG